MLFSEIYGSYYQAVGKILSKALSGTLDGRQLRETVQNTAFEESLLTIPDSLRTGKWALLNPDYTTPLRRKPAMPLTLLEKRWMKAILLDPRMRLFDPDTRGLEDVEPLFRPEWLVYFDRDAHGDDYSDAGYIQRFRTILKALREKKQLEITYHDGKGGNIHTAVSPQYLEYSEKNDRFRLVAEGYRPLVLNLSRLERCVLLEQDAYTTGQDFRQSQSLTLELTDERDALSRVLFHFSHLEKETKRLDDSHYRVTLHYDRNDETEMLIRILSFGPMVRVTEPEHFRQKLRERLMMQDRF